MSKYIYNGVHLFLFFKQLPIVTIYVVILAYFRVEYTFPWWIALIMIGLLTLIGINDMVFTSLKRAIEHAKYPVESLDNQPL